MSRKIIVSISERRLNLIVISFRGYNKNIRTHKFRTKQQWAFLQHWLILVL